MRLPPVWTQLLFCLCVLMGPGAASAQQDADRCSLKPRHISEEESRRGEEIFNRRTTARITYPPAPATPWAPEEDDGYSISDQGQTDPGLAHWRYRYYTPCPQEKADADLLKYGGHTHAIFHTLAQESVLGPNRNGERLVEAALAIGKKITDMGYDFDTIYFTIHIVDDRVWKEYQSEFKRNLARNSAETWGSIEDCNQRLVVKYRDYVPARCAQFKYLRRNHLAAPQKPATEFIDFIKISNDAFAESLKTECRARTEETNFCSDLLRAGRGSDQL